MRDAVWASTVEQLQYDNKAAAVSMQLAFVVAPE
jgi:hypothetical protein